MVLWLFHAVGVLVFFVLLLKQVWWYFVAANVFSSVVAICCTRPENAVRQSASDIAMYRQLTVT